MPSITAQHVVYRGTDKRIHALGWLAGASWQGTLAALTAAARNAVGAPAGYMLDQTQHMVYRATDKRIHELSWSASAGWQERTGTSESRGD